MFYFFRIFFFRINENAVEEWKNTQLSKKICFYLFVFFLLYFLHLILDFTLCFLFHATSEIDTVRLFDIESLFIGMTRLVVCENEIIKRQTERERYIERCVRSDRQVSGFLWLDRFSSSYDCDWIFVFISLLLLKYTHTSHIQTHTDRWKDRYYNNQLV